METSVWLGDPTEYSRILTKNCHDALNNTLYALNNKLTILIITRGSGSWSRSRSKQDKLIATATVTAILVVIING